MPDPTPENRFAHGANTGSILMRCPVCHTSRYVSEFIVTVRKEPQRCPVCTGAPSYLEPAPHDDRESSVNRLRSSRRDTGERARAGRGDSEVN